MRKIGKIVCCAAAVTVVLYAVSQLRKTIRTEPVPQYPDSAGE